VRSEKVDIEEIASTKSEKLLAVVLGVFVLIGAIWAYARINDRFGTRYDEHTIASGVWEIVLTIVLLSAGLLLLSTLRRRRSRYLPLAFGVIVPACILALVFAGDYTDAYYSAFDLGPLLLSVIGIVLTAISFAVLQRYLARRIPGRRVRKGECPFCGYPSRAGSHCEGCGRDVIGECSSCGKERRVGTSFCTNCGKT
jgi:peptidoglycan/LPS O-acetylase OafA/YrhL